jgi:hypothetical protein
MDSILWNLDRAIENMSLLKDIAGGNNRLSKEAALIFKTRVALFEGSWQKYHKGTPFATEGADPNKYFQAAVNAGTELMTAGKYKVGILNTGKPASDYNSLFNSTNLASNTEVVLWAKFDKTQTTYSHNFQQYVTWGTNLVSVTKELVLNYLKKDGTPYDYDAVAATTPGTPFLTKIGADCDPRLTQVIWIPGQTMWDNSAGKVLFTKPFLDKTGENKNYTGYQMNKGVDPKDPPLAQLWVSILRNRCRSFGYAEALMNYTEALRAWSNVNYATSLNLLRARAGLPAFTVQTDANRSKYADFGYPLTDQLYEIRRERAVELACEGFRHDDWRRWKAHQLFKSKRPLGFPFLASEYSAGLCLVRWICSHLKLFSPDIISMQTGLLDNINNKYWAKLTQEPGW